MMKKALFMLAMLTCIFASCSDGGSDNPVDPTPKPEQVKAEITIDSDITTNGLSFSVESGEQTISFSVNTNWTLSVASTTSGATWCKASATSGSKGTATVKFTVEENTDYDDRSVSVTIKAGTASKTFTITQKGADALLVTTKKYEVAQEGGKIEVEVKANISYELTISETDKDWITESKSKSRALKTSKHSFEIALNEEAEKREGEIIFKSGEKADTVKVYQAGGALILLSQNEYTIGDAGETISVEVKSNVEYGVQMPDVDWITDEASSRGMSSHTLKYIISANEGYDSRSAEIIFYDKNSDLKDTLKVVQTQKDAIVISEKNISVDKEGGTIEVKVNTNVDFEVHIPSEATWISKTDSRALKEKSIFLKVAKNTSDNSRSADITITNKDSQLTETIVLTQQGNIIVATLNKAGDLKALLGEDYLNIKSLKIIGSINGDDMYYLLKMLGSSKFSEADWGKLTTLDLSEASIVEGGEPYLGSYTTSNNVIGDLMFYDCANLQNIILPNNLISIGEGAFAGCKKLTTTIIPDNTTYIGRSAFSGCESLTSMTLPENITLIEPSTFYGCSSLEKINIPTKVDSIGSYAFSGCKALTKIVIPEGVTSIEHRTFRDCTSLTEFLIPQNVTQIGQEAFSGCSSLKEISIPDNVTMIDRWAFKSCSSLNKVIIGKNVKQIKQEAFLGSPVKEYYIYATTPPKLETYWAAPLYNVHYFPFGPVSSSTDKKILYVPAKCGVTYKESQWGDYFSNIIEMD